MKLPSAEDGGHYTLTEPMRILVIKLSSLGDLFHALPTIHLLRTHFSADVDWVTQPEYEELIHCVEDVDKVFCYPRRTFIRDAGRFFRTLKQETYDVVFDLQGLLKSAMIARVARTKRRIGPSFTREGARLLYDECASSGGDGRHAVEEVLDTARHLGITEGETAFPIHFPSLDLSSTSPRIGMVPCSRWPAKNWLPGHFAEVGRRLRNESGGALYLFGSPADAEVCGRVASEIGGAVENRCGETSIVELGSALQAMDLVIAVDSGPMHMAAASGTPVLAVFGATDPARTGPYGRAHRVVMSETLMDNPDLARAFKRDVQSVGWDLSPDKVVHEALDMLHTS